MFNQDLLYLSGYVLFIILAFKLLFLSNKTQPTKQEKVNSPKSAGRMKIPEKTQQIKHEVYTKQIKRQQIKKEEIQQQKQDDEFTKFNLIPILENHSAEDEDSRNLKVIEKAIEQESQLQKLSAHNQSKIIDSDTETLQKKVKQKLRREKEINRLKAVKDHYKTIIAELQRKLQNHCRMHNESLESINPGQSIIFQEQDSCSNCQQNSGPFQLNVSQINNLKEQLYMHQQILTNLLEEQNELKDKVRELECQNKKLLESSSKPKERQQIKEQSQILVNILQNLTNNQPKIEYSPSSIFNMQLNQQSNIANIKRLYESHIIEPERIMERSTVQQENIQNYMAKSTINMMSILEGGLNVGLLGQCRFLNEINKKFVMREIKKAIKKRVSDTEIAYNSEQIQRDDILSELKQEPNILFLIKLANSKKLAIFVQYPFVQEINNSQEKEHDKNFIVLMDLNKRKSITVNEFVRCEENTLVFGNEEIIITRSMPLSLSSKGSGVIITQDHPIQQLIDHSDKTIGINFLQIYSLICQE